MLNSMAFKSDTSNIEAMLEAFFCVQPDKHVQDWRWHCFMLNSNPNYLEDIAKRQAAKREAGK